MGHNDAMTDLRVSQAWVIPARELTWRFSRSSGPGGQGVNTTDSRVELVFDVANAASVPAHLRGRLLRRLQPKLVAGRLTVTSSEHRSQLQNRNAAATRLAALLAAASAPSPPPRRPTRPTRASQSRRLAAKKRRSLLKQRRRIDE